MIMMLGVFDDSVTDSLADLICFCQSSATSAVSTFFRDAVTDRRFAILGAIRP